MGHKRPAAILRDAAQARRLLRITVECVAPYSDRFTAGGEMLRGTQTRLEPVERNKAFRPNESVILSLPVHHGIYVKDAAADGSREVSSANRCIVLARLQRPEALVRK
ncbi:MAG: hypothetical protein QOI05_1579 [Bradyrhizobium sp.]|nr:hypothetical protein [Bradyrhizobium sp.]